MVAETSKNWLGLEGEAAAALGVGGRVLPPPLLAAVLLLALLLLELLAESCFFFELLNFTLPASVSFNFSNNLLIGLSMMNFFFFLYPLPPWAKSGLAATSSMFTDQYTQLQRVDIQQNKDAQVYS